VWEEKYLKGKIIAIMLAVALVAGILSGCVEEKTPTLTTNNPPTASFTYTPEKPSAGEEITFNASGSSDPDEGTVLSYSWDFDNDGVADATGIEATWNYTTNGTYTVTLTVNDTVDEDTYNITIIVGNVAPTAAFTYTIVNLTVTFTDQSMDPNGDELTYLWDFGDNETNTTQSPVHTYAAAGTYNVTLTVTDPYNLSSYVTEEITVE